MNRFHFALILAVFAVPSARAEELPRAEPGDVGLSSKKLTEVRSVVQGMIDQQRTAGVQVLVARHGKIAFLEAIGKMNLGSDATMRPDAIFRIYSMTKPITSVATLMLCEEGKLKLDDPVSKYLPEFKDVRVHAGEGTETVPVEREMTIRDLLRHTSGLTYGFIEDMPVDRLYRTKKVGDSGATLAEFTRNLAALPLKYQPGTHFNYSYSTDVLARVVEVVSEKSFDDFLRQRILEPLDMHDTGFFVAREKLDRLTASHTRNGESLRVSDPPGTSPFARKRPFLSGGGGLTSTARDYARFAQMLLNEGELQGTRILRKDTVQEMTKNQLPAAALPMKVGAMQLPGMGFGLGVSVRMDTKDGKPDPAAGEYGWSGAASTYFWVAPRSEMVVVILQQLEPFNVDLQLALRPVIYAAIEQ